MARDYTNVNSSLIVDKESFKDLDLTFTAHPISGDLVAKKDTDAIFQAIKNIVLTNNYERPFKPNFGADLRSKLFQPNDFQNRGLIKKSIVREIMSLEPRVNKVSVNFLEDSNENKVNLRVAYSVSGQAGYEEVNFSVSRVR